MEAVAPANAAAPTPSPTRLIRKRREYEHWNVPYHLEEELAEEFGLTLQAAAHAPYHALDRVHKATGLGYVKWWKGERVLCAPPHTAAAIWINKAYHEVNTGGCPLAVLVVPASVVGTGTWSRVVEPCRDGRLATSAVNMETRFLPKQDWYLRRIAKDEDGRRYQEQPNTFTQGIVVIVMKSKEEHERGPYTVQPREHLDDEKIIWSDDQ